jgi:F0F1-type ATP synthase assembly protein I
VEYGLIVSFALLIGFCLGVLVMTLLDASEAKERSGRAAVRVHEASPSRR